MVQQSIPSVETLIILSKLLGLELSELFVLDGEPDLPDDYNLPDDGMFTSIQKKLSIPKSIDFLMTVREGSGCTSQHVVYIEKTLLNQQTFKKSAVTRLSAYHKKIYPKAS